MLSTIDPGRVATEQDVLRALVALGSLPKRDSNQVDLDLAAYRVALEGVKVDALTSAARAILQGALGHAFFPSPPEIRMRCNEAARDLWKVTESERLRQKAIEEAKAFPVVVHSEASKARVAALHQQFLASHAEAKLAESAREFRSGARRDGRT